MALVHNISGVVQTSQKPFFDERGEWHRAWDYELLSKGGADPKVNQVSISINPIMGTLRGMHYLLESALETKSVHCFQGSVQDVVIDMRTNSSTFLDHKVVVMDAQNNNTLTIPPGCAHGFQTLENNTSVAYIMSVAYNPELECGIRYDDPAINITWPKK